MKHKRVLSFLRLASSLIILGLALGACGIPTANGPTEIPQKQVPFHLLEPVIPTTTTSIPTAAFSVPVTVFFVNPSHQRLVASARSIAPPGNLKSVLGVLLVGPTTIESEKDVGTDLASATRLLGVSVGSNVATLNFNQAFGSVSGTEQMLAVAQIVYTVAEQLGDTFGVQFEIAGKQIPVPIATGPQVSGPVHVLDYASLAPVVPTPTTAANPG